MDQNFDKFPAEVYARSVLAPDLDIYRTFFSDALHDINVAHGIMLAKQGLLSASECADILAALDEIHRTKPWANVPFDGSFEDLFFLVEQELGTIVGAEVAGKLHTGRSRNDIEHTMFRMELRLRLLNMLDEFSALAEKLIRRAEKGKDEVVLLYTHGQPAQPSVLGHYLGAAIEFVLRDMRRIRSALGDIDLCPMGAAAITTSGFPLDRAEIARLLGFSDIVENSYGAIAGVDHITSCYSSIRLGCLHLGRLVQDLVTWTGFEVRQIDVPDGFVQISSIMPQKRNPVPLEHLRLKLSLAAGGAEQIVQTMHNTPFADMNDSERETQAAGFAVFDRLSHALPLLGDFITAMEINRESVQRRIQLSMATITELADTLVREEGISFRAAHGVAHALSKSSLAQGVPLDQVDYQDFANAFETAIGKLPTLSKDKLKQATSAAYFIEIRDLPGGPGAKPMAASLAGYSVTLQTLQNEIERLRLQIDRANVDRTEQARKLAGGKE
jgi:argininosuccinate lyase